MGFIAQILLDLDQLDRIYYQRYNGSTVDYGEYFKLTYFDRGRSSVVECHPCVGKMEICTQIPICWPHYETPGLVENKRKDFRKLQYVQRQIPTA